MNIDAIKLMQLRKNMNFGETPVSSPVTTVEPPINGQQAGLNALMAQGMSNMAFQSANLALQGLNMNETQPQVTMQSRVMNNMAFQSANLGAIQALKNEPENPSQYGTMNALNVQGMNNVAFQGLSQAKNKIMGAVALATALFGAYSCDDKDTYEILGTPETTVTVTVTVNYAEIIEVMNKMLEIMQQMLEQQQITSDQFAQANAALLQMMVTLTNIQNNQESNSAMMESFYLQMYDFMTQNDANQQAIIALLTQNGKTQEEANEYIAKILEEVEAGNLSEAEAMEQILNELAGINSSLANLQTMYNQILDILAEMKDNQVITNSQLAEITGDLKNLYDEVLNGNITAEEFYQQAFEYFTSSEVNIQILIEQIVINKGKTVEEANALIQELIDKVEAGNISTQEALNTIIEQLGSIDATLKAMFEKLGEISDNLTGFYQEYTDGKDETLNLLSGIYKQNMLQTDYLYALNARIAEMQKNLSQVVVNTNNLLELAQDDSKYEELITVLKQIEAGNTGSNNEIDYDKLKEMFDDLGLSISEAINMSQSEIIKAINDFQSTYITTEQSQTELLSNISSKLEIIANFDGMDQSEVIAAIDKLTDAVTSGNDDVSEQLAAINDALEKILDKLDAIYDEIGNLAKVTDSYYTIFLTKFNAVLDSLSGIKTGLSNVENQQMISNAYLESLENKADELLAAIKELEESSSSNITLEELEKLWQEQNESSYNNLQTLIESLGLGDILNTLTSIKDVEDAINDRLSELKDYSSQLDEIIALLKAHQDDPDYTEKLDKIIELLENFAGCNCNCSSGNSSTNEGIIGDMEGLFD